MKFYKYILVGAFALSQLMGQTSKRYLPYFSYYYDNISAKNSEVKLTTGNSWLGDAYNLDGADKFTVEAWVYHSSLYFRSDPAGTDWQKSEENWISSNFI